MTVPRPQKFDTNVRAKRLEPTVGLMVEAQTIGTPMVYALPVDNASRSGMLLNAGRNRKVPYRVNTLLELIVDPACHLIDRPVHCLGKIVRLSWDEGRRRTQYGVQIVQIEAKDAAAWDKAMASLEEASGSHSLPAAS